MKIGMRKIGSDHLPFVVAEIGVNYDNSMVMAEEMIAAAKRAGADAVKFQTYTAKKIVAYNSPKYWKDDRPEETQFDFFLRSNKFYLEEAKELAKLCDKNEIIFMSTPFDLDSVSFLDSIDVPAFKISSSDLTNFPLIRKVAKIGKPIFLSTGAATIGEIEAATQIIENESNKQIVLLHCVLAYPTLPQDANLKMILNLKKVFPDYEIGWSDHVIPNESLTIPTVAVALGATVIEKHFTIDRNRQGNDHFHSVDELLMKTLVENVRLTWQALGEYTKRPLEAELPARKYARRSIAAYQEIKRGDKFTEENLTLLRPGTGIEPIFLQKIIGLTAKNDIKAGYLLEWDDLLK
ncbi:MAG: N-acetylneuraminate synthase family protein [Candidatus Hodarchaeota archaeon]